MKLNSLLFALILIFMSIFIYSCEDDALLTPQIEEECVGSYCNLSMPGGKKYLAYHNPELF